jgi:precorrin-2 dehydrogenase/sirohydrochlorin ferrochelatase
MQKRPSPGSKKKDKRYYPLCLDLEGKKVSVIGGGKVAERKILSLLECSADVTIISPSITEKLRNLFKKGKLRYLPKAYEKGDLKGSFLVISATGEKGINMKVSEEAELRGCLCNVVDDPEVSNFIVPSVVKRGKLLIAISTSGVSPAFSKRIRKELEKKFGKEYTVFLNMMEGIRRRLMKEIPSEAIRKMIFYKLVNSGLIETIKEKGIKTARIKAKEIITRNKT